MTNENNQRLQQILIELIEHTNDEKLLYQCMQLLSPKQEASDEEEGDEIVESMAVTTQLMGVGNDKQSLVSNSLASHLQAMTSDDEESEEEESGEKETPNDKKWWMWVAVPLLVFGAVATGVYYLTQYLKSDVEEFNLVTVADEYRTITVAGVSFNMVKVEGGTFVMGATEEEKEDADSDEMPAHEVTLSSYYIGETEVTQDLWKNVMGESPMNYDGNKHPMKNVSWDDCQQFIQRLRQLTGLPFSLPTEAQWEYAARGGKNGHRYQYAGSNDIDEVAWFSMNSWDKGKDHPDFGNHEVGTKAPNELGIYDMAGNVWEWCQDSYLKYTPDPQTDPLGKPEQTKSYRVNRGGSWDYIASSARITNRRNRTPDFRNFNLGLRLALPDRN